MIRQADTAEWYLRLYIHERDEVCVSGVIGKVPAGDVWSSQAPNGRIDSRMASTGREVKGRKFASCQSSERWK